MLSDKCDKLSSSVRSQFPPLNCIEVVFFMKLGHANHDKTSTHS